MARTADQLVAAAREQGLLLRADGLKLDESGADFLVAHAVDENHQPWVVRVPRRKDVLDAVARECRVLSFVRKYLPVAVPEWRVKTAGIIAYPRLAGTPAATIGPAGYVWHIDRYPVPDVFIDSLADTLAALHRSDTGAAAQAGVPIVHPSEIRTQLSAQMNQAKKVLDVPEAV